MKEEQDFLIMDWWEKLQPLIKKFTRETFIVGFDKDDIRQECFLQLQKAMVHYSKDYGVPFESYFKIMLYGWRSNQNKTGRKVEIAFEEEALVCLKDERVDVEAEVERKVLIEQTLVYLDGLEKLEKQIVEAYYFEHKKLHEIAAQVGLGRKAVEARKRRVLNKLRQYFVSRLVEEGTSFRR